MPLYIAVVHAWRRRYILGDVFDDALPALPPRQRSLPLRLSGPLPATIPVWIIGEQDSFFSSYGWKALHAAR